MPATLTLGAQWGDEGKGKIVDRLARGADLVVRFQGGANAGHTLVVDGTSTVLHLVPSGVLTPGCCNVIGPGCVVDPLALLEEMEMLRCRGIEVSPRNLVLSGGSHLVLPFHHKLDRAEGGAIGTTGRGIGPCYADRARRLGVRAGTIPAGEFPEALQRLAAHYDLHHGGVMGERALGRGERESLRLAAARLAPHIADTTPLLADAIARDAKVLYEGAQGTLLDLDHGTYPFVTSSSTTIGGALTGGGVYVEFRRRIGVVKAYTTRVGNGPFPTEEAGEVGDLLRRSGGEFGATTGRPRRCGWLDLPLLEHAIRVNGFTEIALTKLDVLTGIDPIPVAIEADALGHRRYRELEGWQEPIRGCDDMASLPAACKAYVSFIEERLGVPATLVSTGPGRDEIIERCPAW